VLLQEGILVETKLLF